MGCCHDYEMVHLLCTVVLGAAILVAVMTTRIPEAEACARYLAGEGTPALALEYGVTPATLRRKLVRAGVKIRRRGAAPKLSPEQIEQAQHLAAQGLKRVYIAAVLRISLTTLRRYLAPAEAAPTVRILGGLAVKRCSRCWVSRPLAEFRDDCSKRDGMQSACKRCLSAAPPAVSN